MKDNIARKLVKTGCYVNAKKTNENTIKTPNGDDVIAYLSCRLAISDVDTREMIEESITEKVENEYQDDITIVAMATAGMMWAHAIAQRLRLPLLYIRSSEKKYGLKGLVEGDIKYASKKAIIVDDVLYTGNTIKMGKEVLKEQGIETVGVACIATLRDKAVTELEKQEIKVLNLTDYRNIIKSALEENILSKEEYDVMKNIYEGNI